MRQPNKRISQIQQVDLLGAFDNLESYFNYTSQHIDASTQAVAQSYKALESYVNTIRSESIRQKLFGILNALNQAVNSVNGAKAGADGTKQQIASFKATLQQAQASQSQQPQGGVM